MISWTVRDQFATLCNSMSHTILLSFILFIVFGLLGVMGFSYFEYSLRLPGRFFSVLPDGTNVELTYLDRPNVSTKALLSWATLAATATYTLDFVNYQDNLERLRGYFTVVGYEGFVQALHDSGTLAAIIDKKLVLTAVPIGPAIVLTENEVRGKHSWKVEVPITVSYLSASAEEKRDKLVTLTITQVPTYEANKGIGISQYLSGDLNANILE
jgi:intracellular multiplication protein IcmL